MQRRQFTEQRHVKLGTAGQSAQQDPAGIDRILRCRPLPTMHIQTVATTPRTFDLLAGDVGQVNVCGVRAGRQVQISPAAMPGGGVLMRVMAQLVMVMNPGKCIGCHICSVTCKQASTNRADLEYAWFNNVETRPGLGYAPAGQHTPVARPISQIDGRPMKIEWSANWDDDLGGGPEHAPGDPLLARISRQVTITRYADALAALADPRLSKRPVTIRGRQRPGSPESVL